jgi:hypothetical protein
MDKLEKLSDAEILELLEKVQNFPFEETHWENISTEPPIKNITYAGLPVFPLKRNIGLALTTLFPKKKSGGPIFHSAPPLKRMRDAMSILLFKETNEPKATVCGGSVIAYWQEHADYIATVKPSLLENLLKEICQARALKISEKDSPSSVPIHLLEEKAKKSLPKK